jgi:hypothetical protein
MSYRRIHKNCNPQVCSDLPARSFDVDGSQIGTGVKRAIDTFVKNLFTIFINYGILRGMKERVDCYALAEEAVRVAAREKGGRQAEENVFRGFGIAELLEKREEKAVVLLFYAVEGGILNIARVAEDFKGEIADAVRAVIMNKGERQYDYETRLRTNRLALTVKLAEARFNSEAKNFSESEINAQRAERYRKRAIQLEEWLNVLSEGAAEFLRILSENYRIYTPYSFSLYSSNPPYLKFFSGLEEITLPLPAYSAAKLPALLRELSARGYLKYTISMYFSIELTRYGEEFTSPAP